jgi:(p)ppGpp synthase/HD superfamily hydrolase
MNVELIEKCKDIAYEAHEGQYRKFGKKDKYYNHVIRVAHIASKSKDLLVSDLGDEDRLVTACIALLHDTIEDTFVTPDYLRAQGIPQIIIDCVIDLSHKEHENYFDYIMRLKDTGFARIVKLADLEDNMSDLEEGSLKDKYRFAQYVLRSN